ncbi:MAG: MIP/aquaporin family protein [Butyricicoccaceae bacterium]
MKANLKKELLGEWLGTYIMVLFGCGSVAVTTLFGSHQGLYQIAMVWALGVTLAIYMCRNLSCAHFNPAVTIAMAAAGRMGKQKVLPYLCAQFFGAFAGGLTIYGLFGSVIREYEAANNIVRGTFESVTTAKMFGEYYLQPGGTQAVSLSLAAAAELFGTFLLVLTIFLLTEDCNVGRPSNAMAPLFIGLTVGSIICLIAPLTQAGLNPARDFGPRVVALLFGWGQWAMPDASGGFFWVYILAPVVGGLLAALLFTKVIEPEERLTPVSCGCEKKKTTDSV